MSKASDLSTTISTALYPYLTSSSAASLYQPIGNYLTTSSTLASSRITDLSTTISSALAPYLTSSSATSTYQTIANMSNYINNVATVNTDATQNIKLTSSGNTLSLDYAKLMTTLGSYLTTATASSTNMSSYLMTTTSY